MTDLQSFQHGEEGTHTACQARIEKEGGKATCCVCASHEGCALLELIRERRKYEYRTLDGYRPTNLLMHYRLSEEIELEMKTIGGQNKTKLRKEAKGNARLTALLKKGEITD